MGHFFFWIFEFLNRMVVKNVLDGGLGTLVQSRGGFLSDDDLWVSSCLTTDKGRQELKRAHLDYLRAGADIIKTSSYQISVPLLRQSLPEITEVLSPVTFAVVLSLEQLKRLGQFQSSSGAVTEEL